MAAGRGRGPPMPQLGATRATEFYATAGEEYVEYVLGSFSLPESEWTEASRLFDVVLKAQRGSRGFRPPSD